MKEQISLDDVSLGSLRSTKVSRGQSLNRVPHAVEDMSPHVLSITCASGRKSEMSDQVRYFLLFHLQRLTGHLLRSLSPIVSCGLSTENDTRLAGNGPDIGFHKICIRNELNVRNYRAENGRVDQKVSAKKITPIQRMIYGVIPLESDYRSLFTKIPIV